MPTFPKPVAIVSFDTAKALTKGGKKAFILTDANAFTKYLTYPATAEANLDDTEFDLNEITSAENDSLDELTYDAANKSWPIIKGRKMY